MIKARIAMPETATTGQQIEIKTLVSHPMESGFRLDASGSVIPRNLIEVFEVRYLGAIVFAAKFGPGIAANPFLSFFIEAKGSGDVEFVWREQSGEVTRLTRPIHVVAED